MSPTIFQFVVAFAILFGVRRFELAGRSEGLLYAIGLESLARDPNLRLSVNLSARSMGYPRWMRVLRRGLAGREHLGQRLIFEIAEASAMQMPEVVAAFMAEMRRHGISWLRERASLIDPEQRRVRLASGTELAQAHADELAGRIREMQAMQRTLQDLAKHCHGDHRPDCPILDDLAGARAE
mgnify:CR=1 FL=1